MDQIKIGKFIAQLRREKNLTQQAMGEQIGVTGKTISRWENGNYMPDIEMFMILGDLFDVSINELLSGERLSDADYRRMAEKNIVSVFRESSFNAGERMKYFKSKWLREHLFDIILSVLFYIAVTVWSLIVGETLVTVLSPAAALVLCCIHRNRMMSYCENRVYHIKDDRKQEVSDG